MIIKPGKTAYDVKSYRPISLLPILSKIFERMLLSRLIPATEEEKLIPDHQFGFRARHATIDQIHRLVRKINIGLEAKQYCTAVLLDILQAFDKVWHIDLLYKIKKSPRFLYFIEILSSR